MARSLHFPVYLEVGVREDMVRAVESSLGIRGFHPDVRFTEPDHQLVVAAYMKDGMLENAAFAALAAEVKGLPEGRRRIVHERELAPVLETALNQAGYSRLHVLYLPGKVDISGEMAAEDVVHLHRVREDVSRRIGVPLYASFTPVNPEEKAAAKVAPELSESSSLLADEGSETELERDPMGGLRVTGVTMKPMRFVTTADGRRLFEGALLPGGCTLEKISTKELSLRRGEHTFTYRLRGAE